VTYHGGRLLASVAMGMVSEESGRKKRGEGESRMVELMKAACAR
jgi:hypothetical protein